MARENSRIIGRSRTETFRDGRFNKNSVTPEICCPGSPLDKNYVLCVHLTNQNETTFYTGVTGRLIRRSYQHRQGVVPSFTKRYNINKLLYYEGYLDIRGALQREKQLKKWHLDWKVRAISKFNPSWRDLSEELGVELGGTY